MKSIRVLVLPGGSRMATGIIKYIKKDSGIYVVAADSGNLAPGLYLADKGYQIPLFSPEDCFLESVWDIIEHEHIDLVIPALDPILLRFMELRDEFENRGAKVIASPLETLVITNDKWKTFKVLQGKVPVPQSFLNPNDIDIPYPLFMKPRCGSGSIDAVKIESQEELSFYFSRIKDPIIQEYLDGEEYTVDCMADMSGNLLFAIPRVRLDTKAGVSVKGEIRENKELQKMAQTISDIFSFCGPFLFQAKEKEGNFRVMEINARFGGGMPLSCAAGPNIYSLSARMFLGERIEIPPIRYGMSFTRYDEEIFLKKEEMKTPFSFDN